MGRYQEKEEGTAENKPDITHLILDDIELILCYKEYSLPSSVERQSDLAKRATMASWLWTLIG